MKTVAESKTESVFLVLSQHINGSGRLFGGVLLQWIDTVGAVVARRHCGGEVTTAAIDNLEFVKGVTINSTVVMQGKITHVGRTSMEVCVETFVEEMCGSRCLVNRAYIVFVAVKDGRPVEVPGLLVSSQEEYIENENGKRRQEIRNQHRKGKY